MAQVWMIVKGFRHCRVGCLLLLTQALDGSCLRSLHLAHNRRGFLAFPHLGHTQSPALKFTQGQGDSALIHVSLLRGLRTNKPS